MVAADNSLPGTVLLEPDPFQEGQPASSPVGTMIRVSDAGAFTIKNVPPGTYKVTAWHEKAGTQTADVTVAAKEEKENNFTFKVAGASGN